MNVDKMRNNLDRQREAGAELDRRRWLASLTPEHRRHHSPPFTRPYCPVCFAEQMRKTAWTMSRLAGKPR